MVEARGWYYHPVDAPQVQVAAPSAEPQAARLPFGAASAEEAKLCKEAGELDWAYLGVLVLADAGTVVLDSQVFQNSGHAGVRLVGPGLVGLSWGWSVGGAYLTLPQCKPGFVRPSPEGDLRSRLPLMLSFTLLASAMAPVIVGVETGDGGSTLQWSQSERVMRLVIASATGVGGSLLPYVLPPSSFRALRKLEHVQANATAHGATVGYSFRF